MKGYLQSPSFSGRHLGMIYTSAKKSTRYHVHDSALPLDITDSLPVHAHHPPSQFEVNVISNSQIKPLAPVTLDSSASVTQSFSAIPQAL